MLWTHGAIKALIVSSTTAKQHAVTEAKEVQSTQAGIYVSGQPVYKPRRWSTSEAYSHAKRAGSPSAQAQRVDHAIVNGFGDTEEHAWDQSGQKHKSDSRITHIFLSSVAETGSKACHAKDELCERKHKNDDSDKTYLGMVSRGLDRGLEASDVYERLGRQIYLQRNSLCVW